MRRTSAVGRHVRDLHASDLACQPERRGHGKANEGITMVRPSFEAFREGKGRYILLACTARRWSYSCVAALNVPLQVISTSVSGLVLTDSEFQS